MLIALAALAALAAAPEPERPPEEVAARAEASARYGKEIPWAALCWARPEGLAEAAPLVVGVSRAATGCETFGVVVGGAWATPEEGLAALVPAEAWTKLSPADRGARAAAYVDRVLLAFARPGPGEPEVKPGRDGRLTVVRRATRRDGADGRAAEVTRTVVVGADRRVESSAEVVDRTRATVFYSHPVQVDGLGGTAAVQAALGQVGGGLQRCVDAAWREQLTLAGHVTLQWQVAGGKLTALARVEDATRDGGAAALPPLPESAVTCLSSGLRRIGWAPDAAGVATWTFLVEQR